MATNKQIVELQFPVKGLHVDSAYRRQPELTTPACLNVRPFDPIDDRDRGGQRDGLSKYYAAAIEASQKIQNINSIVEVQDASIYISSGAEFLDEDFNTYDSGNITGADWQNYTDYFQNTSATDGVSVNSFSGTKYACPLTVGGSYNNNDGAIWTGTNAGALGNSYVIEVDEIYADIGINNSTPGVSAIAFRVDATNYKNYYYVGIRSVVTGGVETTKFGLYKQATAGLTEVSVNTFGTATIREVTNVGIVIANDNITINYTWNGTNYSIVTTLDSYSTQGDVGILFSGQSTDDGDDDPVNVDSKISNIKISNAVISPLSRRVRNVVVCGNSVYTARKGDIPVVATDGTDVFTGLQVYSQPAYQNMYFVDGTASGYRKMSVGSAPAVTAWTPSYGSLPVGSVDATIGCKNIALYRGRIVLWGLSEDPHNWFMSAVGNPLDWDYAGYHGSPSDPDYPLTAVTSATMAVAGNNSDAGLIGDVLTACCPYSDDIMVMGGDHTLWVMRGDPAAGGVIDNISYQIGIAGPESYTWDSDGNLFFFGQGRLWVMGGGDSTPRAISKDRVDSVFKDIDPASNNINLIWDTYNSGLHIFVSPLAQPDTIQTHYFWHADTDSFWADKYGTAAMGPSTAFLYDGIESDDRAILIGGYDGYVRQLDASSKSDDGTSINSYVDFTPLVPGGDALNAKISNIRAILDSASDPVRLELYTDDTVEDVVASTTPRFTKTLSAGRNNQIILRAAGNAIRLRLENDDTDNQYQWALESLTAAISVTGRTRYGGSL